MIGLKRGVVILVKHTPKWKGSFEEEKRKLKKIFGVSVLDIQHVGSTAIPGILAKPVIDIGIIVPFLNEAKQSAKALRKIGYIQKKDDRIDRLFFTKGPEKKRTHYLHIGEKGSGYVEDMILFRDYLRKHRRLANEYSELKEGLYKQYGDRRNLYTAQKEKFVKEILKKAKSQ